MTTSTPIEQLIPHRYENILLDSYSVSKESQEGDISLLITDHDELGRDIFFHKFQDEYILLPPICLEILALGSIVIGGGVKPNQDVYFASISNINCVNSIKINTKIQGSVKCISHKAPFYRYQGELSQNNTTVCTGDMMAYISEKSDDPSEKSESNSSPLSNLPEFNENFDFKKNKQRHEMMYFIDKIVYKSETACIGSYFYPENHPLTKGHFPKNPVMMGVCQLQALADTLLAYVKSLNSEEETIKYRCKNAELISDKNELIASFKQLELTVYPDQNYCKIDTTKKITFRQIMKPGHNIYIYLNNLEKTE